MLTNEQTRLNALGLGPRPTGCGCNYDIV